MGIGYTPQMGSKEKNTEGPFSEKDTKVISSMPSVTVSANKLSSSQRLAAGKKRKADGKAVIKKARQDKRAENKAGRKAGRIAKVDAKRKAAKESGNYKKEARLTRRQDRMQKRKKK
tara:strand:+ start:155 stop:505 length:351 start_codon:yes stop_codon:yes gene_type:complete